MCVSVSEHWYRVSMFCLCVFGSPLCYLSVSQRYLSLHLYLRCTVVQSMSRMCVWFPIASINFFSRRPLAPTCPSVCIDRFSPHDSSLFQTLVTSLPATPQNLQKNIYLRPKNIHRFNLATSAQPLRIFKRISTTTFKFPSLRVCCLLNTDFKRGRLLMSKDSVFWACPVLWNIKIQRLSRVGKYCWPGVWEIFSVGVFFSWSGRALFVSGWFCMIPWLQRKQILCTTSLVKYETLWNS